jgi:hypothetical protein
MFLNIRIFKIKFCNIHRDDAYSLSFAIAIITSAQSYRRLASAGTSCRSYRDQGHDERDTR